MKLFFTSRGALLVTCAIALSAPIQAQPQPSPRGLQTKWRELRRTWSASELTDPQGAIAAYEKFYRTLPSENGDVAVEVVSRVAQLYGNEMGQREKALEIYRMAMKQWNSPAWVERLQREYDLMSGNAPQTVVPSIEIPSPISKSVSTTSPTSFDARMTSASALVELLAAKQEPEAVWAQGQWTGEDVVWALEHIITDDGILKGRPREGKRVREGLGLLLGQHGRDLVSEENWRALPSKARLWLGDYYRREKKEKTVAVLESVLLEMEAQGKGKGMNSQSESLLFFSAERLSWYYRTTFEHEKGAQTWLRVPPLLAETDWRVPDALIGAARAYGRAGEEHQALMIYLKVPSYGHGRFTGISYLEQSRFLSNKNRHEEARELLRKPLTGPGADRAEIVLSVNLAASYETTGDEENARKYALQAITQYKALKNYTNNTREYGLDWSVESAKDIIKKIPS